MKIIASFRFFVFLALLGGLAFAAGAADGPGPRLNLKSGMALSGRFVHEHPVAGFDQPLRSEGSFLFAPGRESKWIIEKPMATTTTLSPSGVTQSVGNFALLKITHEQMPFLKDVERLLLAALNGDWATVGKDFTVKRSGSAAAWKVTLTPRAEGRAPFQRMIASGGAFVDSVRIEMRSATDTVLFSDQKIEKL